MTEAEYIAALRELAPLPSARGLADDAAVIEVGDETLVLTHDTLVEGVHVREGDDPADIAWKLVAVNLSDLAAKGAIPVGILLSHMLGEGDARFLSGLREVLDTYEVPLLGGDTVKGTGARSWGCTAIGRASHVPVPDRRGARPGDTIHVTGALGGAMLGFEGVEGYASYYSRPAPLLEAGQALAPHVTAMMDVSDGLLLDAWRLGRASGACCELDRGLIPVAAPDRGEECLRWGDDYQLLFTLPEGVEAPVEAARIGRVTDEPGVHLLLDAKPLTPDDGIGYTHD